MCCRNTTYQQKMPLNLRIQRVGIERKMRKLDIVPFKEPQLNDVHEREIMLAISQIYQLFSNETEMRRHWRIDHHKLKDDLSTSRLPCPVGGCHKTCWKREWHRKHTTYHSNLPYTEKEDEKKGYEWIASPLKQQLT